MAGFSPDGSLIVTVSRDKTARVWDAATGAGRTVLAKPEDEVLHAAFSPNGNSIATALRDGRARIWRDLPSGQDLIDLAWCIVPRQLTKEERIRFFLDPDPTSGTQPRAGVDCDEVSR
jgi:WD40 repeat protein